MELTQAHTNNEDIRFLDPNTLAAILGVHYTTIWRLRKRGELPPEIKLPNGRIGWLYGDVRKWLESHRVTNNAA